jgi:hypothetical protein
MTFAQKLHQGHVGESVIASWFRRKNYHILPVYEIEKHMGKGPRLYSPRAEVIAPDMLVFTDGKTFWIEAKHKEAFSWHRKTHQWTTGIDMRHYRDYCIINDSTPFPVWLLFLQKGGQAKDSPLNSPSGLYGNSLSYLQQHENHRSEQWGRGGMVYWSIQHLKLLDTLDNVHKGLDVQRRVKDRRFLSPHMRIGPSLCTYP